MDNENGSKPEAGPGVSQTARLPVRVLVTGATGFVGRAVVRELVARGYVAVCLVRDLRKLEAQTGELRQDRWEGIGGELFDDEALGEAARGADAAIHLVGIIAEQPLKRQTFERINAEGTQRVVEACQEAGVRRLVHMSALGTRPGAACRYHQTKWTAEECVRSSGLDWTIFRPSVIHGPDGEFMRLMRRLACAPYMPLIPYFGDGQGRIQPVSVRDVARCFVGALSLPATIGQAFPLGGPEAITWKELYRICREKIPDAKAWKPVVGQPVPVAKLLAMTFMKLPILPRYMRFNVDQVQMSQEDSVCDVGPVEEMFGIQLRDFRRELGEYAARIT